MPLPSLPMFVRSLLLAMGVVVAGVVVVVLVAYVADTGGEGRTVRGLHIDEEPAGNLGGEDLDRLLARLENDVSAQPVLINLPAGTEPIPSGELGVHLDTARARSQAMALGREGGTIDRFRSWLASFTTRQAIPITYRFAPDTATARVARLEPLIVTEPVEPRLILTSERELGVQPGSDGLEVDQEAIVERLAQQVDAGGPFEVDAPVVTIAPDTTDAELEAVADRLNALTEGGVTILLGEEERTLPPHALRVRLDTASVDDGLAPAFDLTSLQGLIEHTFGDVVLGGDEPVFDIVDDVPVVLQEGTPPMRCCAPEAAAVVAEAILTERAADAVAVEPIVSDDPRHAVWASGEEITEKVGGFTTTHNCCEARVGNIQRFADIVRGVYLLPGESLSLNEHVGERTTEKGFVPAGTIVQGHLISTVGGGVSQFATTMFNAAFLAGFDFDTYQSHSIYFSRYPFGREATISWPLPDLKFTNTTDYPALIWTSYEPTSITVSIYSTRSVEVEQTHQEISSVRRCTRVDTFRSRTYDDGRQVEDSVFAVYRPAEGLDCNGNPTTRPG